MSSFESCDPNSMFGDFKELVAATNATKKNWLNLSNIKRDFGSFSKSTFSLSVTLSLQIQDEDGSGLREASYVSLALFAKFLLSKLAQSNFISNPGGFTLLI